MTGALLAAAAGLCASGACLAALAVAVPARLRVVPAGAADPAAHLRDVDRPGRVDGGPRSLAISAGGFDLARRVGAAVRRRTGVPVDDAAATLAGSMLLIAAPLTVVDFRLGVVVAVALRIRPVLVQRRRRSALEQRVVSELPEVIDLVRLGMASGGSTLIALRAVAARPTGPVTEALAAVIARVGVGHRMADALEDLPAALGEPVRPLVRALVSSERYGVELGPTLDRLADEARDDRRRRAQARARRVPVQMLLPLVLCILPAFVVLTLVPTLVSTFETLEL